MVVVVDAPPYPLTVNGIGIECVEKGRGRPLLFLHPGIGIDETVAYSRCVCQQVSDRDLALGRLAGPAAVGLIVGFQNLRIFELGDVLLHRIVERDGMHTTDWGMARS